MKAHNTAYTWKDVLPSMRFGQVVSIICSLPGYVALSLLLDNLGSPALLAKSNPAVIGFVLYFTLWTIPYTCICCMAIYFETELLEMRFAIGETAFCAQVGAFVSIYLTGITAYCRKNVHIEAKDVSNATGDATEINPYAPPRSRH